MEIVKFPHPALLKPCKEVIVFTPELKILLEAMWDTMKVARGVGLSANQVGLDLRMFVMAEHTERHFIVNPQILESGNYPSLMAEGCLSAPGEMIKLFRPDWVTVLFQNEKGEHIQRTFVGVHSVCFQHEMEHLDGKSFLHNKAIPKKLRISLAKKWGLKVK